MLFFLRKTAWVSKTVPKVCESINTVSYFGYAYVRAPLCRVTYNNCLLNYLIYLVKKNKGADRHPVPVRHFECSSYLFFSTSIHLLHKHHSICLRREVLYHHSICLRTFRHKHALTDQNLFSPELSPRLHVKIPYGLYSSPIAVLE